MAFQKMTDVVNERYQNFFNLDDDGDSAEVTFLYHNADEAVFCDAHYFISNDYRGYIHCLGSNCPLDHSKIRVQTRFFIPLYNYTTGRVEFWDRSHNFSRQMNKFVFDKYPDAGNYVFQITRHGAHGDVNTTYEIKAIARNSKGDPATGLSGIDALLKELDIKFPDAYDRVIKEFSADEIKKMVAGSSGGSSSSSESASSLPNYSVTPRVSTRSNVPEAAELPDMSELEQKEEDLPDLGDDPVDF